MDGTYPSAGEIASNRGVHLVVGVNSRALTCLPRGVHSTALLNFVTPTCIREKISVR